MQCYSRWTKTRLNQQRFFFRLTVFSHGLGFESGEHYCRLVKNGIHLATHLLNDVLLIGPVP
jgi:hypothetical protein